MGRWLISFICLGILAWLLWEVGVAAPGQVWPDVGGDQKILFETIAVLAVLGIAAFFLSPVAPWLAVFLGLGLIAFFTWRLALNPGRLTIDWHGYNISTSVAFAIILLILLVVGGALLYRLWLALVHGPSVLGRGVRERRRRQGLQALSRGLVAIAAGDAETAQRQTGRTAELLGDPPLTMLLSAQVAQLKGDEKAAARYFSELAENASTAFLGLRGLLTQAMKRGDHDEALALARRAHRINPKSEWLVSTLFELQKQAGRWTEAEATLNEAVKLRLIPATEADAQRSAIRYAQSQQSSGDEAIRWAEKACKADPANADAAIRLADLLIASDRHPRAVGVLETAWERQPSPELAEVYWRARKATDALSRFESAKRLAQRKPRDAESQLIVAATAIEAKQWDAARASLEPLASAATPSPRVCRLMAELEEGQRGDRDKARMWLLRATAGEYGAHSDLEPAVSAVDVTPKPAAKAGESGSGAGTPTAAAAPGKADEPAATTETESPRQQAGAPAA